MKSNKPESIQSKGGKTAANNMTKEEKIQRAKTAAQARWNKPKAKWNGSINILDASITCAVLEDERRVISMRSLALALGTRGGGRYWEMKKRVEAEGGAVLPEYVSAAYLSPFVDEETKALLLDPISYTTKGGDSAQGFEATILPKICDIWINAAKNGALKTKGQLMTSERAYDLLKGFSELGIIALVDEATGFQEVRDKEFLAKFLESYLQKAARKWELMFQLDYYKEIYRLKQWKFVEGNNARPGVIGKYTNNIVYDRLEPGVLKKLNDLNPKDPNTGRRKAHHHRFFSGDVGLPELKEHLSNTVFLMKSCDTWEEFLTKLDRAKPKVGKTLMLPGM